MTTLDPDRQLFFVHVPKTAGTTLIGHLDTRFATDAICPVHWPYERLLERVPDERLATYRFIRGHFPYCMIDRLPTIPIALTVLRDPVDRFVSEFAQATRPQPDRQHPLHDAVRGMSLAEYVEDEELRRYGVNALARYFGGTDPDVPVIEQAANAGRAIEVLDSLDYVGLTERFDESLDLFSATFALPPVVRKLRENVDPSHTAERLPDDLRHRIAEINATDYEVYEHGVDLVTSRLEGLREGNLSLPAAPDPDAMIDDLKLVPPGAGWYEGEPNDVLGLVRWTGPGTEATLRLGMAPGATYSIAVRVLRGATAAIAASAGLSMNGWALDVRHVDQDGDAFTIEAVATPEVLSDSGWQDLAVSVAQTAHVGDDARLLGVCAHWARVERR